MLQQHHSLCAPDFCANRLSLTRSLPGSCVAVLHCAAQAAPTKASANVRLTNTFQKVEGEHKTRIESSLDEAGITVRHERLFSYRSLPCAVMLTAPPHADTGKAAFVPYLTAGYPKRDDTVDLLLGLQEGEPPTPYGVTAHNGNHQLDQWCAATRVLTAPLTRLLRLLLWLRLPTQAART
jgi:hypothetical protein